MLVFVVAVAGTLIGDQEPPRERSLPDQLFVADAKLRRTLRFFDPSVIEAEPSPIGGEGLAVNLKLDPDELLLRFDNACLILRQFRNQIKQRAGFEGVQTRGRGPKVKCGYRNEIDLR